MIKRFLHIIPLLVLASCNQPVGQQHQAGTEVSEAAYPTVSDSISLSRENAITRAVQKANMAVVSVAVTELVQQGGNLRMDPFFGFYYDPGRLTEVNSLGSGFIISEDGLVVTNQHVLGTNSAKILVTLNHEEFEAELIGSDEFTDIALIQIVNTDRKFTYLEWDDTDRILVGEWCIAMGNPFGLFDDGQPTVTVGVVSAINRDFRPDPEQPKVFTQMIQTDAAINSGNSGGPLMNSQGKVIGMNTFIFTPNSGNVGLSFAIPARRVKRITEQLLEKGEITLDYDWGMETVTISPRLSYRYNIPLIPYALLVISVNKDGPAFESGIRPKDVLLKIGSERVQGSMHAQALMREYSNGDTMRVEIVRDNTRYETGIFLRPRIDQ